MAAIVKRLSRPASRVQLSPIPTTAPIGIHISTKPPEKASPGSASIVQALVVDEPALSAVVKLPSRRPPNT